MRTGTMRQKEDVLLPGPEMERWWQVWRQQGGERWEEILLMPCRHASLEEGESLAPQAEVFARAPAIYGARVPRGIELRDSVCAWRHVQRSRHTPVRPVLPVSSRARRFSSAYEKKNGPPRRCW